MQNCIKNNKDNKNNIFFDFDNTIDAFRIRLWSLNLKALIELLKSKRIKKRWNFLVTSQGKHLFLP